MLPMKHELLSDIDDFQEECRKAGRPLSDSRISILGANNGRLVERLRSGGDCGTRTVKRMRAFLVSESIRRGLPAPKFLTPVAKNISNHDALIAQPTCESTGNPSAKIPIDEVAG